MEEILISGIIQTALNKMKGTVYPAQVDQSDRIKESSCLHRSYALEKLDYFNFYYFYDVRTEFF